jgi:hypothetical protein
MHKIFVLRTGGHIVMIIIIAMLTSVSAIHALALKVIIKLKKNAENANK